ncbi:hypothetical protein D2L64_14595 [Micromonospora radicis]|uniref:Uncharacterized protein n=1 Tax=Micromonospora radicis TaxID=1894971 RepID=A0A418MU27_9ACTN|nr:hypothetical protein D2L64_14595 [Micromonospora radicis]
MVGAARLPQPVGRPRWPAGPAVTGPRVTGPRVTGPRGEVTGCRTGFGVRSRVGRPAAPSPRLLRVARAAAPDRGVRRPGRPAVAHRRVPRGGRRAAGRRLGNHPAVGGRRNRSVRTGAAAPWHDLADRETSGGAGRHTGNRWGVAGQRYHRLLAVGFGGAAPPGPSTARRCTGRACGDR